MTPEALVRRVIDDCDTCRFLMHEDCLFFPALYRLVDWEARSGTPAPDTELRKLVEGCTLCGLCPCPDIRRQIINAKTAFVARDGMPRGHRLLANVQRLGRMCGMVPRLVNTAMSSGRLQRCVKRIGGIHPARALPRIPDENFFDWAATKGLCEPSTNGRGVAYFAGCSAGYLFPEVGRAAVRVLQESGADVFVPTQQCCGMPMLVEGDAGAAIDCAQANVDTLLNVVEMGHVPLSSCPTCGFMIKVLLKEGAYHSTAYQRSVAAGADEIKIPRHAHSGRFNILKKSLYAKILNDDGLFNRLDPLARIALADAFQDVGEYLAGRLKNRRLTLRRGTSPKRIVYFAPCHQREQKIGSPYLTLLARIPGIEIEPVGGAMDCCGMGGSLGYKSTFHDAAVSLGSSIARKIDQRRPNAIITDCLSCRLQFQQLLPYPVHHPLEMLRRSL